MTDAIVVGIIAAVPATIASVAALIATLQGNRKVDNVSLQINGRLTELLKSVGAENLAAGRAEGVNAERARVKQ